MTIAFRYRKSERGAVAIIVGLSLPVLIGFAGLALDLGRLFVTKTELQNAADACALAAANELVCDPTITTCPREFLQNAQSAGIYVAGRNKKDFQGSNVSIVPSDIKFFTALAPNSSYLPAGTADTKSRFAMCTASATGLIPYLMGALGFGPQAVSAQGAATRAPAQSSCNSAPVGICAKPSSSGPNYGYSVGEWITSSFTGAANNNDTELTGGFRWVDYTANAGGTNEVRNQLLGNDEVCGIRVGNNVTEQGVKQGAKSAWNTRFGFYPNGNNAEIVTTAPPDKTGYSYPSKSPGTVIAIGSSAYADYVAKQATNKPFIDAEYDAGNISGSQITQEQHLQYGAERRLVASPIISCDQAPAPVTILAMACVLMLNPMASGPEDKIYLEWRGLAKDSNACRSAGVVGGVSGPRVPTLVQ